MGNAPLLNQDELACAEQGLGRSSRHGPVNASFRGGGVPSLSTDQFKRGAGPGAKGCSGLATFRPHCLLKISSRLEEGETSRFGRVAQRRLPARKEARRLLSPFILSSVRKKSVKARKYSKVTSWLQAGKGSWRRKPQWPPWRLSRRKK